MFNSHAYATHPMTNNPFIDHTASTAQRFPDISQPPTIVSNNQSAWGQGNPQYPTQQQQQQPQWQTTTISNPTGMFVPQMQQPQQTGYPTSQTPVGIVSGSSYSYLNPSTQPQQQQQTGYHPAQQQLQNPGYISQFDPYSALGRGWGETTTTTTITAGVTPTVTSNNSGQSSSASYFNPVLSPRPTSLSPTGDHHPREYIRLHKASIESWDTFTWKTFLSLFDKLKAAWETRRFELQARVGVLNTQVSTLQLQTQAAGALGYSGYMQVQQYQQELTRVQDLEKQAAINFDSVAASTFQMREVYENYRQSGDLASKRRVREATNNSLQSLPDWPQPIA
ncbi:hypothetical protein AGABI1DRAFT_114384 [Agaricus bisporus var. burnettii JB137-S8]|uniref:Uncharacterized protein n=1 Tax=Agaricus bisporus var. burnettii (strain JB137-S8 / ATCC MYA-4627 / FGSC 10392) TaxID=597362 RepID=K5X746_AGABU|nr:uncharacterized protein AGABI1DRAFT_114384 [Agaricus bisporus var. burnettii JB137-S8]EKM78792.1 hypothetical protein AGABI1DRAFT_114384 [Agaricus bisporus var. burnettii JB137-S8]